MAEAARRSAGLSGLTVTGDLRGGAGVFGQKANALLEDYMEAGRVEVLGGGGTAAE